MKAVKQLSTGRIVYRQSPEFEPGKGILSAKATGFPEADLEEISITQVEWDAEIALRVDNNKETTFNEAIIKALAKATLDEINALRTNAGLATKSLATFKANIKAYL